nr:hypothetical protein BN993_07297 [Virgibacillus halodenitrificans]
MSSIYQKKFWRELDQLKVHVYYLELYLEKTENTERGINIFLAAASSGSIASWAVWNNLQFLWATIIAASQFINVIKPHLPYSLRLKSLSSLTNELESLFISMENHWFHIAEGRLTEEEIHRLHIEIKEKRRLSIQKHLGKASLPHNEKIMERARQSAKTYFINFYE